METQNSKDVIGYECIYSVTKDGRIFSHDRFDSSGRFILGKVLKPRKDKDGYLIVTLAKCGVTKTHKVHRIVASTFIENPECKSEVNHIDEDKTNNTIINLEWVTPQENSEHSNSKHYIFINPEGERVHIFNLNKFCKENSLNNGSMTSVNKGSRKHHKGWTAYVS